MNDITPRPDIKYLAIDPGETTGFAVFDSKGILLQFGQFESKLSVDLGKALDPIVTSDLDGVIIEDYKNHGWMQQKKWGRNQTSKHIGAVEMLCALRGVPLYLQPNTVKDIGYKWAGLDEAPAHSISHQYDAVAHGVYWLQSNGIRKIGQGLNLDG